MAKLTASDGAQGDRFGRSVAISDDLIGVGAYANDAAAADAGATYVFARPTNGWLDATESTKLSPSDAAASDQFGSAVAIDGETMVVGADGKDDAGSGAGAAYVFVGFSDCDQDGVLDGGKDCDGNGVPDECDPDCDGDGIPDDCDLVNSIPGDVDGDGDVDLTDLATVLANFGKICPQP